MLELFDQNPGSRVFHVDRECYIVYLGSHWDDYRPFLRIGTSTHLPSGLPPIISSIVVPDVLTGNPLEEAASLEGTSKRGTHYIGDVKTVERLKAFLHQEKMPVEGLTRANREVDDNKHVYVYYYRDGNVRLKYHKSELIDLRRRERQDGHFVARAQSAKNEYGRSPFKLPSVYYQRTGFVVRSGAVYLSSRGDLAALSLPHDYFFDLCSAGIDPDRVATVWVEDTDAALIRFFKRSRAKERMVRVASPHPESVRDAIKLFGKNSLPKLDARILKGHGGSFEFHGMKITQAPGRFEVHHDAFPGPLVVGQRDRKPADGSVHVDASARRLTTGDSSGGGLPLIEGCLYIFPGDTLTRTLIRDRYLPEKNYPYRDMLSANENTLIAQLEYFFNDLFAGRDPGKVARTIRGMGITRSLSVTDELSPVLRLLLLNYRNFIAYLRVHEPELGKKCEGLTGMLDRLAIDPAKIPAELPLVAELFGKDGSSHGFIRFAVRITGDRVAHAQKIAESISAEPLHDFEAERSRLEDLVAGLATPEQMDEARMRRIAEARKREIPAKPPEVVEAEEPEPKKTPAGRRGRRGRGEGNRWLIAAAAVVVIGVLAALFFTGVIPNRWFGATEEAGVLAEGSSTGIVGEEADTEAGTSTEEDGQLADSGTGEGQQDTAGRVDEGEGTTEAGTEAGDQTPLPEGWPEETREAVEVLQEMPGVTVTPTGVIGPGGIEITVLDIIALVNQIATDNGYARMDQVDSGLPDPDLIYPDDLFTLPNEARYTVVDGDTLWGITVRYMVARLQQDLRTYESLSAEYETDGTSETRKREILSRLEQVAEDSHAENFTRLVEARLSEWGE
jgi:hypothetical protein